MVEPKTLPQICNLHAGERVRVIYNAHAEIWLVYNFESDRPIFYAKTLELHTVGIYGELKPDFAPQGAPSFVGTIPSVGVMDQTPLGNIERLVVNPAAPGKVYWRDGDGWEVEFKNCRRILLDGPDLFADNRHIQ